MAKKQTKKEINEVEVINVGQVQTIGKEQNNETIEDRVQFEIGKFNFVDSEIAKLKKDFKDLKIKGLDDKEGIAKVADALKIISSKRTGIESKRSELKDFYLNTGRGIDAEAKRIQALIAEVEIPLKEKKNAIDLQIKQAKEEEEARLQKVLDDKVQALKDAGIVFDGSFYSIGDSISVDLMSIKDLDEEGFQKLIGLVSKEKERLDEIERLKELHNERKEQILPFWSFLTSEMHSVDFSQMTDASFVNLFYEAKEAKEKFDKIQADQEAEAEKQIQERKDLNFEKRSFKFEKEGFDVNEDGVSFVNEIGNVIMSRKQIEELNNPEFEQAFTLKIGIKSAFEKEFLELAESRKEKAKKDAEDAVQAEKDKLFNDKLSSRETAFKSLGFKRIDGDLILEDLKVDMIELGAMEESEFGVLLSTATKMKANLEREKALKDEKERLEKLPDLDKVERYCQVILEVDLPEIKSEEVQKELQILRNEIKRSIEKTLSNIKTIKDEIK